MRIHRTGAVTLCLSIMLLHALPTLGDTAVLSGTIVDGVNRTPIPFAVVVVNSAAGKFLNHVITGTDGTYSVGGLTLGAHVKVSYSCRGYKPHLDDVAITLSSPVVTQDEALLRDVDESAYWKAYAEIVSARAAAATPDKSQRISLYNEYWSALESWGLSAMAQAQAAREFIAMIPEDSRSPRMSTFAAVDLDSVRKATADIHVSVNGNSELSRQYSIPLDVAAQIAADEIKGRGSPESAQPDFKKNFEDRWGTGSTNQISIDLKVAPDMTKLQNISNMAIH